MFIEDYGILVKFIDRSKSIYAKDQAEKTLSLVEAIQHDETLESCSTVSIMHQGKGIAKVWANLKSTNIVHFEIYEQSGDNLPFFSDSLALPKDQNLLTFLLKQYLEQAINFSPDNRASYDQLMKELNGHS